MNLDSNLDFEDGVILMRNMAIINMKIMENATIMIIYVNLDQSIFHHFDI